MNAAFGGGAPPADYWEERARRFARPGLGLAAVCSYGMPAFHNLAIHATQRLALRRALRVPPRTSVLDVGCGVGRWSRSLARGGALVTGVDLSPTMVREAERRARREGISDRCRFEVADIASLNLGRRFRLVLSVTVLQHILDPRLFREAVARLAAHVSPEGSAVLLEAAPTRQEGRCDTPVFRARDAATYVSAFREEGLHLRAVWGVDPAPFRPLFLPHYRTLPRALSLAGLVVATAAALPVDLLLGRRLVRASWHKVMVFDRDPPHAP